MTERVRVAPLSEQEIGAIAYRGCSVAHEYFNRLLSIARDHAQLVAERDALRAELARIRAHIESSHNEVTCSQDARHANDGDDRVPMLTCMTLEAHTLRAENTKLRERGDKFRDLEAQAAEHVEVPIIQRTDFNPDGEIVGWPGLGLALNRALDERDKLRERAGKLERVRELLQSLLYRNDFPRDEMLAALAALDEEAQP